MKKNILVLLLKMLIFMGLVGQENNEIILPKPRMQGGKPILTALKERHTERDFSTKELSNSVLSDLLWAAYGVNRPESGKRTAPSARNKQEIDIYVVMSKGTYKYDAFNNKLIKIIGSDIREATGMQPFVKNAPVNILYIADFDKMGNDEKMNYVWSAVCAGAICQNIYLFCASEGLATVVRGLFDSKELSQKLKLKPNQKIILAQTIGYPMK